jgi:hypothetical protein
LYFDVIEADALVAEVRTVLHCQQLLLQGLKGRSLILNNSLQFALLLLSLHGVCLSSVQAFLCIGQQLSNFLTLAFQISYLCIFFCQLPLELFHQSLLPFLSHTELSLQLLLDLNHEGEVLLQETDVLDCAL